MSKNTKKTQLNSPQTCPPLLFGRRGRGERKEELSKLKPIYILIFCGIVIFQHLRGNN